MTPKLGQKLVDNPKDKSFTIRLNDDDLSLIDECSKELGLPKAQVIRLAVKLLHREFVANKKED